MKAHLANAAFGVLDYAAYPIGMLAVAPVILRHLGLAEYGLWTIATAAVSTGGIIASGFGDANIQHVAAIRSATAQAINPALIQTVRSMVAINLVLGTILAFTGLLLAPIAARHILPASVPQQAACLTALRIASVLMLLRALESVSISTLRAFERYGAAVRVSIAVRLLTLAAAALLASMGFKTASIMAATAVLLTAGTILQYQRLARFLEGASLLPSWNAATLRTLARFGVYTWLQAVAGVLFGQVDRLLIGLSLGATAVASYALSVQLAQPIWCITAAALHFLFPYLSGRIATLTPVALRRTLLQAAAVNLALVAVGCLPLLFFGRRLLQAWAGPEVAALAAPILPAIVTGSALLGLGVTATYALLAFGRVRLVAILSLSTGAAMLIAMAYLLPTQGLPGLATARLAYGAFALLLYVPLLRQLATHSSPACSATPLESVREVA